MKIRITRGIYGFMKNGNVIEKTKSDPPFEVDDKEGKRLVSLKVAEFVNNLPEMTCDFQEEENRQDEDLGSRTGYIAKSDLEDMSRDELIALAEELGIKKNGNKADLIERLMQCPISVEDEAISDESELPELSAEEPN